MSMGIVGVKSTAGRAVKCIDPSKTTRSESAWLGYTFCVKYYYVYYIYTQYILYNNIITLQWRTKVGGSKRIRYPRRPIHYIKRWDLNCIYKIHICKWPQPVNLKSLSSHARFLFLHQWFCSDISLWIH